MNQAISKIIDAEIKFTALTLPANQSDISLLESIKVEVEAPEYDDGLIADFKSFMEKSS